MSAPVLVAPVEYRHPRGEPQRIARRTILLHLIVLGLIAYGAEAYFTSFTSSPWRAARAAGRKFDNRTFSEVAADLNSAGVRAFPDFSTGNIVGLMTVHPLQADGKLIVPLGGVSNAQIIEGNENGQYQIYRSDEHGFNNPPGLWAHQVSIALIGDSFTEGCCVPGENSFAGVIRSHYPGTLNLGMHTSGPLVELSVLKEYLPDIQPKVVLWLYSENDMLELKEERKTDLRRYLDNREFHQTLIQRQPTIDRIWSELAAGRTEIGKFTRLRSMLPLTVQDAMPDVSRYATLTATRYRATMLIDGTPRQRDYEQLEQILRKARLAVEGWGGKFFFVHVPGWAEATGQRTAIKLRDRAMASAKASGATTIPISEPFRQAGSPEELFVYPGSHYNECGHSLIGNLLVEYLRHELPNLD